MKQRHTPTYADVWRQVSRIPRGRVATYGSIGRLCGSGARFVGYALHNTPSGLLIPWQRVINSGGRISLPGEAGRKQRVLLEEEGVAFNGKRISLSTYGWRIGPRRRRRPRTSRRSGAGKHPASG